MEYETMTSHIQFSDSTNETLGAATTTPSRIGVDFGDSRALVYVTCAGDDGRDLKRTIRAFLANPVNPDLLIVDQERRLLERRLVGERKRCLCRNGK